MFIVFLKLLFLFPWLVFKRFKDKKEFGVHLYGIYGFFGLPGRGKTMAMSRYLREMRKKYGDSIYIMTNYYYDDQDFAFETWQDLLKPYDRPLICAWDEIQNYASSRDWKSFPPSLLTLLTQVRKNNGIQILYTAQRWHFVDKIFRSLTFGCYECNTLFGSLTYAKYYDALDYENLCSKTDSDKRFKIKPIHVDSFIQTDDLRNCYNSYRMLEAAKTREYMDRQEMADIYKLSE